MCKEIILLKLVTESYDCLLMITIIFSNLKPCNYLQIIEILDTIYLYTNKWLL